MELKMKLAQSQILTPQMELSVRILQMDSIQLNDYLKEVMLENPVVELEQPPQKDSKEELALRKLEWLESQTRKEKENTGYYDEYDDLTIEKTVAAVEDENLVDHLLAQVSFSGCARGLFPVVRFVIGCLDENGYLTTSDEEMCSESGFTKQQLADALDIIRGFEPTGVGAHDLGECLCLQLPASDILARRLAREFIEEISKNRLTRISKQLGVAVEEITCAIERIRRLNPKPGALYCRQNRPEYITPDVVVTNFENQYNVMLCGFSYPEIRLSESYLRIARESSDKEVAEYIGNKINQINWIKKCIESRNDTLLAVARAIVKRQERFFRYGPRYLNVLRMKDVAEMVGLHESTISRAVRHKYLQCSYGVYPLRHFFVKGVDAAAPEAASSHDVKWQINEIVEAEEKSNPLSDQKITELLNSKGVGISRRTVAKYREELGIAKSADRVQDCE